jgi:hypothetical protein
MKPSGKFEGFATKTPEHDELQLWVSDPEHQNKIVEIYKSEIDQRVAEDGNFEFAKYGLRLHANRQNWDVTDSEITLRMERPVFGYNKFLIGIIDGAVHVTYTINCNHERNGCRS